MIELCFDKKYRADDGAIVHIVERDDPKLGVSIFTGNDQRLYYSDGRSIQNRLTWSSPAPYSPRTLIEEIKEEPKPEVSSQDIVGDFLREVLVSKNRIKSNSTMPFSESSSLTLEVGKGYFAEDGLYVRIEQVITIDIGRSPYRYQVYLSQDKVLYTRDGYALDRQEWQENKEGPWQQPARLIKEYGVKDSEPTKTESSPIFDVDQLIEGVTKAGKLLKHLMTSIESFKQK